MPRPETVLQRKIKTKLELYGFYPVHVPNGAVLAGGQKKRAIQSNSLKADGVRAGFPDYIVYGDKGRVGHIEVKTADGEQSPKQVGVQIQLESMGQLYAVCRSEDEVDETLISWGWMA